jgi:hypothetical protein
MKTNLFRFWDGLGSVEKCEILTIIILPLLVVSGIWISISIETEFNFTYYLAFKWLAIPMLIISVTLTFRNPSCFNVGNIALWKKLFYSVAFGFMLTLFGYPYMLLLNSVLPPQQEVVIEGKVVSKFTSGRLGETVGIVLDVKNNFNEPYQFAYSKEYGDQIKIGDYFSAKYKLGGLGFVYNWKR